MRGKDQATLKPFLSFFADGNNGLNRFRVAHFQRPYVWPENLVWQLMEDLWDLFWTSKPSKPIGCVITHATSGNLHEIVDGQQRLITLHIVFRAVVYWCRRHGEGELPPFLQNLFACDRPHKAFKFKDSQTGGWAPRFMLFDYDEQVWFHSVFLSLEADTDELLDQILMEDEVPQQRLPFVNNFKTVLSFLADRKGSEDIRGGLNASGNVLLLDPEEFKNRVRGGQPGDQGFYMRKQFSRDLKGLGDIDKLDAFLQYALEKTTIIHFVTYDPSMAVDIFNALNRPGLPLAAPQRLKASLLVNIDYSTVDGASSVWNEAERKMMTLFSYDKEPLTPFLRCLLEMTPKPPTVMAEDYFYSEPSCPGKFRQSHRLDLLDEFQEFCVERRSKIPPAHPDQRLRLYERSGQPNNDAVAYFIETYLNGPLVPMYISMVNLGDQNSWGEGTYLGGFSEDVKVKVQNSVSCLRHLYHLDLDRDWVYPALLASHLWGLNAPQDVAEECVEAFFTRLETFASYLVVCRPKVAQPIQIVRDKAKPPLYPPNNVWMSDKLRREDRMPYYRELMEIIYKKSPRDVVQWLELTLPEKTKLRMLLNYDSDQLFSKEVKLESDGKKMQQVVHAKVPAELQKKVLTYLLLKAEDELSNSPQELMESYDNISMGLRHQSSAESSVVEYRQLDLRPLVPQNFQQTEWHHGWTPAQLTFVRDNLRLGNLSLTLQNRQDQDSAENFDGYSFRKFLQDVYAAPHHHGFLSTIRLAKVLERPDVFTNNDLQQRHRILMQLCQKSWNVITEFAHNQLKQDLSWSPKVASGLKNKDYALPTASQDHQDDQFGGEAGESDLDRMLNTKTPELGPGVRVRIQGLQKAPTLNGKIGKVLKFVGGGRYQVETDEGVKSLKADNMAVMPSAPAYDPTAKKVRILPGPKRKAQHVDPTAKTNPCKKWELCDNFYCRDAHTIAEWRCYQFAMGQCVPQCSGFVKSCPSKYCERKRKIYSIEFEERKKITPAKRPRLDETQASVKELPKAAFPAHGVAPWAWGSSPMATNGSSHASSKIVPPPPKHGAASSQAWFNTAPTSTSWPNSSQSSSGNSGVWAPSATDLFEGTVTELKPFQKYGFITADDNNVGRVFFHYSRMIPPWSLIRMRDRVTFTVGKDPNGRKCAENVVRMVPVQYWNWWSS